MDELSPALTATGTRLADRFGERVVAEEPFRGQLTVRVAAGDLLEVLGFLRDDGQLAYRFLSDVTAVDLLEREPRFDLVYHLFSLATGARLTIKVGLAETQAAPSITGLWSGANFMEREVFDLFGIPFAGHPHLERILTPDGFTGHPLRRDYGIGDEPVQFDLPHRKRFSDAPI